MFPLQLFIDMVTGCLGDVGQQQGAANIVSVIVAGNSLSKDTQDKDSLNKVGINTTHASVGFLCLLITFANSLDPDQARQNVGPDLDPNYLILIDFLKILILEKISAEDKNKIEKFIRKCKE